MDFITILGLVAGALTTIAFFPKETLAIFSFGVLLWLIEPIWDLG
jgi:apolipoprotein N-acyltransferase